MKSGTCCSPLVLTHHTFWIVDFIVSFGWVTVCCAVVQAKCLHLIVSFFFNSLTIGHSGRSRGFRHSGGHAATHQVLGSCAILEQRIGRHSHSTTAAASGGRHACGTAVPIPPRTTRPRSTQRRHEVAKAGLCHRMSLSMRRSGGNLECHCCHRRTTWRQCR